MAPSRTLAVAVVALLVATVLVMGTPLGVSTWTQPSPHGTPGSHSPGPLCALSANCGGGGALAAGCALVVAADCASRPDTDRASKAGRVVPSDAGHLPAGVPTTLFRPPKGSWI